MNSSELKGYLTGLILGDGTIGKGITKRSFSIKSISKQFIEEIKKNLESCSPFEITIKFIPAHYSCRCHHKDAWELNVKAHPYFNKKYHHFYNDYRKRRISNEVLNWLTPWGIANWYMSDGYVCLVGKTKGFIRSRRIDFCTDRYTKEDVQKTKDMFWNKFKIKTSVIKRNNTYRIRVNKESYCDFIELIEPYIISDFMYKLYLGYESRPYWMTNKTWLLQEKLKSAIALTDNAEG